MLTSIGAVIVILQQLAAAISAIIVILQQLAATICAVVIILQQLAATICSIIIILQEAAACTAKWQSAQPSGYQQAACHWQWDGCDTHSVQVLASLMTASHATNVAAYPRIVLHGGLQAGFKLPRVNRTASSLHLAERACHWWQEMGDSPPSVPSSSFCSSLRPPSVPSSPFCSSLRPARRHV